VFPVVGDEPISGWLEVFNPVLYPPARRSSDAAPGCPQFRDDSVFERPERSGRHSESSVRPGLHMAPSAAHAVVWWDPAALELDKKEEAGLRQQKILTADDAGLAALGERAHEAWEARRASLLERGSAPTLRVRTVTERKEEPESESTVSICEESTRASHEPRPSGKRFGTLVHAVLATVALDAIPADVESASRAQGRMIGASPDEVLAAARAVQAALEHGILQQARAAREDCRREAPVVMRDEGALTEGILDLAFRTEDDGGPIWTIVDYKTDVEPAHRRPEYQAQVKRYAQMVAKSTGERVRGVILRV
jgi:ATP-dependent helicase/nuclease subunit A